MKRIWITITLAGLLAIPGAIPSRAAEARIGDWNSLSASVVEHDVEVRADGGRTLRGKVLKVTDEEIVLRNKKQMLPVPRAEVAQVAVKQKAKRFRRALLAGAIGAGIAAAAGLGIVAGTGGSDDVAGVVALPIALGGLAGAGVGAALPDGYRVVYRR